MPGDLLRRVRGRHLLRGEGFSQVVAAFVFLLTLSLLVGVPWGRSARASSFSDTGGHWAEAAIDQAASAGYLKGYPDGTFRPDQGVTRAEFVTMLNLAFKVPQAPATAPSFKDVKAGDWFADGVQAAVAAGYVSGYPDGTFRPQQPISRQEAASCLARLLKLDGSAEPGFTDREAIAPWARPAVAALVSRGVINGYPDGSFGPQRLITRGEAAVTVVNALGLSERTPVSCYLVVTGSVVNLRSGPGQGYSQVGQVKQGDVLEAVEKSSNNWYRVNLEGKSAWIAGWLVEVHESKPPSRGDPGTLDVRQEEGDSGLTVTLTAGAGTGYQWVEQQNPQRLVITVPGVTVLRTPQNLPVNAFGLNSITTGLQDGQAVVTLTFRDGVEPIFYRVEKGSDGTLRVTVPRQINHVEVSGSGDGIQVRLDGNASLASYNSFTLTGPLRQVFDFSGFTLADSLLHWEKQLNQDGFTAVRLGQFQDGVVRLVVETTRRVDVSRETAQNGQELILKLQPVAVSSRTVVLDPGHGGGDPGAVGPNGIREKDVNLAIARRAAAILSQEGFNVLLTRSDDRSLGPDEVSDLAARTELANSSGADVFVSIHSNAAVSQGASGTGTYTYAPPGTALGQQREARLRLAALLQEELVQALGRRDNGTFEENFYVLRNTNMPAALVEVAFISNPTEEQLLNDPDFQERAAAAVARGITRFLNG